MIATAKMANSSTGGEIILGVPYGLKAKGRLFGIWNYCAESAIIAHA